MDVNSHPVSTRIRAEISDKAEIGIEKKRTEIEKCTKLCYHIFTAETSVQLVLKPLDDKLCEESPQSNITIDIQLLNCSTGFEQNVDRCVCEKRLLHYLGNDTVCS